MNVNRVLGHWGAVCGLFFAGLTQVGCQTAAKQLPAQAQAEPPAQFDNTVPGLPGATPTPTVSNADSANGPASAPPASPLDGIDNIAVGDSLTVVYNDLSNPVPPFEGPVRQDGSITLLLNKKFVAAGKTRGQLEQEIRGFYVPDYYKQLTVSIKPLDRFFFVEGEVKNPGRQVYLGTMTVLKAVTSCSGFSDFAKKTKVVLTHADGRKETIDCKKAELDPALDRPVYPGDRIKVPRKLF